MDDARLERGLADASRGDVRIFFDGACQTIGAGRVATFGFVAEGAGLYREDCGLAVPPHSEQATNNVAEYVAAIRALEWLAEEGYRGPVEVIGDSQLVIRQMREEYRVRSARLTEYHRWLHRLAERHALVRFTWVPREENRRADELSKLALERFRRGGTDGSTG